MDQQIRMGKLLISKKIIYIVLFLITFIGFIVRIWNITSNPPELFSDEITDMLSARSIFDTGKDVNGKFQFFLYSHIELGAPLYGYVAGLVSYLFGNNVLSARLPAVLFGALTIPLVFLLAKIFFQNEIIAITSAFVIAFSPWAIHFSRVGWKPAILNFFLILPIIFFKFFVDRNSKRFLFLSYLFFALSIYAYSSAVFLAPLFLLFLNIIYWKKIIKFPFQTIFFGLTFAILLIPFIYIYKTEPLMSDRPNRISTFAKGVNFDSLQIFTRNYVSHLSPEFLFIKGDSNLRHNAGTGELLWIFSPFIVAGLFLLLKNYKNPENKFILAWLLIFPLGGSLTNDGFPHASRTLIGLPVFALITGIGFEYFWSKAKRLAPFILGLVLLIFIFEFINFLKIYFVYYPIRSQAWWEYGQKEVMETVKDNSLGNETLCLTNLNYWHEEILSKFYLGTNNKYKLIYDKNDPNCFMSQIISLSPDTVPPSKYRLIKTVNNLDGKPIWIIYKSEYR